MPQQTQRVMKILLQWQELLMNEAISCSCHYLFHLFLALLWPYKEEEEEEGTVDGGTGGCCWKWWWCCLSLSTMQWFWHHAILCWCSCLAQWKCSLLLLDSLCNRLPHCIWLVLQSLFHFQNQIRLFIFSMWHRVCGLLVLFLHRVREVLLCHSEWCLIEAVGVPSIQMQHEPLTSIYALSLKCSHSVCSQYSHWKTRDPLEIFNTADSCLPP